MNCWSAFKTPIIYQLSDNRSLQGYSQLTFQSPAGPPHSELHYSSSHVIPPHCEKCGSATFRIFLSGGSANFLTLQPQISELPEFCPQWELTFLSTLAFRATKSCQQWELTFLSIIALRTLRADVPEAFRGRQKPGRHYASRQLSKWTTQLFGATKILSTVRVDIPVGRSFQSYQNPDKFKS